MLRIRPRGHPDQVVLIHPFTAGNGRMARWLVQVVPRRRALTRRLAPPIGFHRATRPMAWAEAHGAFRDGDTGRWCTFLGDVLVASAADARRVIDGPT